MATLQQLHIYCMPSADVHNKFWHALLLLLWEKKQLADGVLHHRVHADVT